MSLPEAPAWAVVAMTGPMIDDSPAEEELRAAVRELVDPMVQVARTEHGPIPGVGTKEWWSAAPSVQVAGLLILAEAWLGADPERMAAERLRAMSWELSGALNWTAASRRPSHAELRRRRNGEAA